MYVVALVLSAVLMSGAQGASAPTDEVKNGLPGDTILQLPDEFTQKPSPKTCTAQLNCPSPFDYGPIMCVGNSSCQVYYSSISCDGSQVLCSCGIAPSGCADPYDYCSCRAAGIGHWRCFVDCC